MSNSLTVIDDIRVQNVERIARRQGEATQIGDVRVTWKAQGMRTGFQFSVDEVTLEPDMGIPLHRHPFAEFFYVLEGRIDFAYMDEQGTVAWVHCEVGDSVSVPPNAPHTFHNRTRRTATFLGVSTYQHEIMLKSSGSPVAVTDQHSTGGPSPTVEEALKAMAEQQCFVIES